MKKYILEFVRRGLIACGFGPLVLAVFYLILQHQAGITALSVHEVCLGIVSLAALAFIVGGMNVIYQLERLSLMAAILIHGSVLYVSYLAVYLINGWLARGAAPLLFFTVIFTLGYLVIWAIIYSITKKNTDALNEKLRQKQLAEHKQ